MYITIVAVSKLELNNFSTPSCDQFGHYRDYEKIWWLNLQVSFPMWSPALGGHKEICNKFTLLHLYGMK